MTQPTRRHVGGGFPLPRPPLERWPRCLPSSARKTFSAPSSNALDRAPVSTFVGAELDSLQHAVDGLIEVVNLGTYDLVINEEGLLRGLPFNVALLGDDNAIPIVGSMVFVGLVDDDDDDDEAGDFRSLTDAEVQDIMSRWRDGHSVFMAHDDVTPETVPPPGLAERFRTAIAVEFGTDLETA